MPRAPVVFVSTYPPEHCGVGRSAYDVVRRILPKRAVFVVANRTGYGSSPHAGVVQAWSKGSLKYPLEAAREAGRLVRSDRGVAQVNHHFTLYGGYSSNLEFPLLVLLLRIQGFLVAVEFMSVIDPRVGRDQVETDFRRLVSPVSRLFLRSFYRFVASLSWKVIVPGRSGREILASHYGVPRDKIVVVSPGWDQDVDEGRSPSAPASTDSSGVTFLFHGFIDQTKGLDILLHAFSQVAGELPQSRLVIAGEASPAEGESGRRYLESLHELERHLGLSDRVRFTGYLPEQDLREQLRNSDIVVLPYTMRLSIGGSAVLTRVASLGRALIASRISRFEDELEDGSDALLVEPGDVDALAKAMKRLANEPELRARLGAKLRSLAPSRSWDVAAARLETEVYRPGDAAHGFPE